MNNKIIITIGRELGSGGRIIGAQLAKKLNSAFYDKELILRASKESGLSSSFMEQVDEHFSPIQTGGLLGDFFQQFYFSSESCFQIQSDVIREIAEHESAVIVGRGADYVLREHPRCLNIFVTANMSDRIQRVAESHTISEDEARILIEKADKKRASFYNYFTSKEWGRAKSYDLCVNSSVFGLEKTTDYIFQLVKDRFSPIP